MESRIRHLDLNQRKELTSKMAANEVFHSVYFNFAETNKLALLERIKTGFQNSLLSAIDKNRDQPLDAFVRGSLLLLEDICREHLALEPELMQICKLAKESVLGEITVNCETCSNAAKTKVCRNFPISDIETVALKGDCISTFRKMLATCVTVANRYYENHCKGKFKLQSISLSTCPLEDQTALLPGTYHIAGGFDIGVESLVVELSLELDGYDRQSDTVALYVLFHEVFCHVFSCSNESLNRRRMRGHPPANDPFAEGYMDCVALDSLTEFLDGEGLAADCLTQLLSDLPYTADELHSAANSFSSARTSEFRKHPGLGAEIATYLRVGKHAANWLRKKMLSPRPIYVEELGSRTLKTFGEKSRLRQMPVPDFSRNVMISFGHFGISGRRLL